MKKSSEKLLNELRQTPEYAAERLALEIIGRCEQRRAQLGWSYAELARRMGVSRTYISKLMSGTQNSTLGSLVKLALVLECEIKLILNARQPTMEHGKLPNAKGNVLMRLNPRGTSVYIVRTTETRSVTVAAKPSTAKPEIRS